MQDAADQQHSALHVLTLTNDKVIFLSMIQLPPPCQQRRSPIRTLITLSNPSREDAGLVEIGFFYSVQLVSSPNGDQLFLLGPLGIVLHCVQEVFANFGIGFNIVTGIIFIRFSSPSHRRRNPSLNSICISLVRSSKSTPHEVMQLLNKLFNKLEIG
jgi:hypothetical protein